MFKIFQFVSSVNAFMSQNQSFKQAQVLALAGMSREEILSLRDDCYRSAEFLTGYILDMDAREEHADSEESPFQEKEKEWARYHTGLFFWLSTLSHKAL